jgi:integrase
MQVMKNGQQVWCAYYSVGSGKTRAFVRGFGKTEAEAIARRETNMKKRFLSGGIGAIERKSRSPRLSKYLVTWLDDYPPDKLGDETRRKYRRDLEHHVLPHLDPQIADLTSDDLKKLFYKILPVTATPAARWNAYKTIRTMLNHAVKHGEIDVSPLRLVDAPTLQVKVKEADDKWINRRVSMTKYILRWIGDPQNEFHDHYPRVLMMFLGLRRGEILGLEWSCVSNLEKKGKATITVTQQLKRHEDGSGWFIYRNTKNKKSRLVPLPELWRKALLQERDKRREANEEWASDLIFLREDGRHIDFNTHADAWKDIMTAYVNRKKAEKEPIDGTYYFRPHAARHVAASMMFDEGVPLEVAQQILGHSDTAITLYYTHLTRRAKQEAAETLGSALSEKFV